MMVSMIEEQWRLDRDNGHRRKRPRKIFFKQRAPQRLEDVLDGIPIGEELPVRYCRLLFAKLMTDAPDDDMSGPPPALRKHIPHTIQPHGTYQISSTDDDMTGGATLFLEMSSKPRLDANSPAYGQSFTILAGMMLLPVDVRSGR